MLFSWILCVMRPLSVAEFNAALATHKYHDYTNETNKARVAGEISGATGKSGALSSDAIWMTASSDIPFTDLKSVDLGGDLLRLLGPLVQFYWDNETLSSPMSSNCERTLSSYSCFYRHRVGSPSTSRNLCQVHRWHTDRIFGCHIAYFFRRKN